MCPLAPRRYSSNGDWKKERNRADGKTTFELLADLEHELRVPGHSVRLGIAARQHERDLYLPRRRRGRYRSRSCWRAAIPSRTECPGTRSSCSKSASNSNVVFPSARFLSFFQSPFDEYRRGARGQINLYFPVCNHSLFRVAKPVNKLCAICESEAGYAECKRSRPSVIVDNDIRGSLPRGARIRVLLIRYEQIHQHSPTQGFKLGSQPAELLKMVKGDLRVGAAALRIKGVVSVAGESAREVPAIIRIAPAFHRNLVTVVKLRRAAHSHYQRVCEIQTRCRRARLAHEAAQVMIA